MPKVSLNQELNWEKLPILMVHTDAHNFYELRDDSILVVYDVKTREFKYLTTERCTCPAFTHGKMCKHRRLRAQMLSVYVDKVWRKK